MRLCEVLEVRSGVTAVMGSGGKTGLIERLAAELRQQGTVLICTTTKMWLPHTGVLCHTAQEAEKTLKKVGVAYLGEADGRTGKLLPPAFEGWETLADFVLVEADGAAGQPLKAHAPWEPVLPEKKQQTICVVGAAGIGRPIGEVAHRPEIFAELCGAGIEESATPEGIAKVLLAEHLPDRIFVNQIDVARAVDVQRLAQLLPWPVAAGSLKEETWQSCHT